MSRANKIKESDYTSTPLAISAPPPPPRSSSLRTISFSRLESSGKPRALWFPYWNQDQAHGGAPAAAGRSRGWPPGPRNSCPEELRWPSDLQNPESWRGAPHTSDSLHSYQHQQHQHLYWWLTLSVTGLAETDSSLADISRRAIFKKTNITQLFFSNHLASESPIASKS